MFDQIHEDPDPTPALDERERIGLDAARIRAAVLERRAIVRRLTVMNTLAIGCVLGGLAVAVKVGQLIADDPRDFRPYLIALAAVAFWRLAGYARRKARSLDEALSSMRQIDPTTPPDFSTLGDGSDYRRNLSRLADASRPGSGGDGQVARTDDHDIEGPGRV